MGARPVEGVSMSKNVNATKDADPRMGGERGARKPGKRIALVVVVTVVALCIIAFALDRAALSSTYARVPDRAVSLLPTYDMYESDYPRTDVAFELDGLTLRGHVYGAANERGLIVFRHGLFSKHTDYLPFITSMVDKGWRVFAYDAIGCGESDGEGVRGMSQSPVDVVAAVDYARESGLADGMPLVLWGHSWGGYGVAVALAARPDVDACVTMSGFDTPMKILDNSASSSFGPLGKVQWPFLWLNTAIDFGTDFDKSASAAIVSSSVPTLVVHGTDDKTVPFEGVSILGELQDQGRRDGSQVQKALADGTIRFAVMEGEGRNGHNDYFYSPESQAYLNGCASDLQEMLDENGDDASDPAVQGYLRNVDMKKANMADPELIDEVDAFLSSAVR